MSESVAVLVMVSVASSLTFVWKLAGSTGATLISLTKTVNVFVALKLGVPLSTTRVVKMFVPGPSVSAGVQVMMPAGEMLAVPGAARNEYVSVSGGRSKSFAVFVTVRVVNSLTVRLVCPGKIGAEFKTVRLNAVG